VQESVRRVRKLTVFCFVVSTAALAVLAAPGLARAGDVAMRVQAITLHGRLLQAAERPMHFNMFAVHWRGSGSVLYRTHRLHGGWSAWVEADADAAPDGGTGVWHDGNLAWTAASDDTQFRTRGTVRELRAYELWSRVTSAAVRHLSAATEPTIVTRAQWHAEEDIVRAKPLVAPVLKLAVVHHTAGTNTYTRAQAAAIVRGIEVYHVQGNGWNDIGYNFLVDRYGTVYEGRAGGMTRNVIGAHAEGFNSGSVGVALIGNFSSAKPPPAMQAALVKLLAWRLDIAHIDPLATVVDTSGGNLKFEAGKVVTLRAISGHRDTGPSDCPGNGAYALLPSIAKRVAATGLPKIYSPVVAGVLGGPVRFRARLSSAHTWTVTIANAKGMTIAQGGGVGTAVDWTWHSPAAKASYRWTIATDGALSATGTLGGPVKAPPPTPFTLTGLTETPAVITPAADGSGASGGVQFTLSAAAHVVASLVDASGASVLPLLDEERQAGVGSFVWDASTLADGRYTVSVTATPVSGAAVTATAAVIIDRTIGAVTVTPSTFSPNGDGVDDVATLSFTLAQAVPVTITVVQNGTGLLNGTVVETIFNGTLGAGQHTVDWDGTDGLGALFPDGSYQLVVTVNDGLGAVPVAVPVVLAAG
jgi:flagellar hook assembly protein FlgD